MDDQPNWQWDENLKISTDYCDPDEAQQYDVRHVQHGRTEAEYREIIDRIGLQPDWRLMDMGAGSGTFAITAATRCAKVYVVDISRAMLDIAKRKARSAGVDNIEFHRAGFLTYEHDAEPVDAIVTQLALHHLPDIWKQIALHRLAGMLAGGGVLYLRDVIFDFEPGRYAEVFDKWVGDVAELFGDPCMGDKAEGHIRQEFSTFGWIIEGMLIRAGFEIEQAYYDDRLFAYLCRKK